MCLHKHVCLLHQPVSSCSICTGSICHYSFHTFNKTTQKQNHNFIVVGFCLCTRVRNDPVLVNTLNVELATFHLSHGLWCKKPQFCRGVMISFCPFVSLCFLWSGYLGCDKGTTTIIHSLQCVGDGSCFGELHSSPHCNEGTPQPLARSAVWSSRQDVWDGRGGCVGIRRSLTTVFPFGMPLR